MSYFALLNWLASFKAAATPLFISTAPKPITSVSVFLPGKFLLAGTVSRCPAITTRLLCPKFVWAITELLILETFKCLTSDKAAWTKSAIAFSSLETLAILTRSRVNPPSS